MVYNGLIRVDMYMCILLVLNGCYHAISAFTEYKDLHVTEYDPDLKGPEIMPYYIQMIEGESVELTCSIPESDLEFRNSSYILFRLVVQTGSKLEYISLSPVRVTTSRSATVTLKALRFGPLQYVECLWLYEDTPGTQSRILVFRRPIEPTVSSCTIVNWMKVECEVRPSKMDQMRQIGITNSRSIEYRISWHIRDSYELNPVARTIGCDEDTVCRWSYDVSNFHHNHLCTQASAGVRLFGRNVTVLSAISCFKVSDIVKLSPPRNLSYRSHEKQHILIVPLLNAKQIQIICVANYTSLYLKGTVAVSATNQVDGYALMMFSAQPYTEYQVSVQCRVHDSTIWSDVTTYFFSQPSSDVCAQPETHPNGFEVTTSLRDLTQRVKVYWKHIAASDHCGPGLYYRLTCRVISSSATERACRPCGVTNSDQSSYTLPLTDMPQHVHISAVNNLTDIYQLQSTLCSCRNCQFITIPANTDVIAHRDSSESELLVEGSGRTAVLHWMTTFTRLTIYWCERNVSSSTCKGNIDWTTIDRATDPTAVRDRSFKTHLLKQFYSYLYGLSSDSMENPTGIQWSSCAYGMNGSVSVPNINVTAEPGDSNSVSVIWKTEGCVYGVSGFTKQYMVQYCMSAIDGQCLENNNSVTVNSTGHVFNNHILSNLRAGKHYTFWLYSISSSGIFYGPSNRVTVKTKKKVSTAGIVVGVVIGVLVCCIFSACGILCVISRLKPHFKLTVLLPPMKTPAPSFDIDKKIPSDYHTSLQSIDSDSDSTNTESDVDGLSSTTAEDFKLSDGYNAQRNGSDAAMLLENTVEPCIREAIPSVGENDEKLCQLTATPHSILPDTKSMITLQEMEMSIFLPDKRDSREITDNVSDSRVPPYSPVHILDDDIETANEQRLSDSTPDVGRQSDCIPEREIKHKTTNNSGYQPSNKIYKSRFTSVSSFDSQTSSEFSSREKLDIENDSVNGSVSLSDIASVQFSQFTSLLGGTETSTHDI